jgi:acyl carrier protein
MTRDAAILPIINQVLANKRRPQRDHVSPEMRLREELGFDSLDLAELTVRIEEASGVDIFAEGVLRTVGEVEAHLRECRCEGDRSVAASF